jgi:signal transduction histidine kinase
MMPNEQHYGVTPWTARRLRCCPDAALRIADQRTGNENKPAYFLRRAVMNLIDNAIKYNRAGGIVVLIGSTNGENAVLAVRNTGPIIAVAARGKVFERFYHSDFSHTKEKGGHGLGLSIAREIARAHGGDVNLVRSDTEWTEFCVVLPINGVSAIAPPQT